MSTVKKLSNTLAANPRLEGVPREIIEAEAARISNRLQGLVEARIEPSEEYVSAMVEEAIDYLETNKSQTV